MISVVNSSVRLFRKTPFRTFILYPLITLAWELSLNRGSLRLEPLFLPLMLWGYLQYRLCGLYRIKHGGGGPGLETPPERLVATGPYAYTRNPMYLGHIIFLIGLTLTLKSLFAALITVVTAVWFHFRVLGDERNLAERLGEPYIEYVATVKRWLPGLF
ncbi:MAG: methyltransferase family protein [Candidatus Binatia bacterium]